MKLNKISTYFSLVKFSHTVFALPFALVGFMAGLHDFESNFNPLLLCKIILCMVFARNAAMGFNRWADRDIDKDNPRTQNREIPAGLISPTAAFYFIILNCLAFVITSYTINSLCFFLSPLALLIILGYSYTKRFTPLCHLVLGLGLALAPTGAYISVTEHFALFPALLSLSVLFWVSGFDIIYALQDISFDTNHQLKSIPAYLGAQKALNVSRILHFFTATLLLTSGFLSGMGKFYFTGCFVFIFFLVYQHTLVKANDLRKVNQAFFMSNGFASISFFVFNLIDFLDIL